MAELDKKLGEDFRITHYGADVMESFFNVDWRFGLTGEYVDDGKISWNIKPLLDDIKKAKDLVLPDPNKNDILALICDDRKRHPEIWQLALIPSPLETFFNLRQMESAFYDFYDDPEVCLKFIERMAEYEAQLVRGLKNCDVDCLYIAGDICSAKGSIMSHEHLIRFCFEPMRSIIDEAKRLGLPILFHTDGMIMDVLPLIIDYGFDGVNPLQPHLNNIREFKEKFGTKLILYGGLDNCFIIPDGSESEVRAHVRETFEVLGKDGGLIASSHDIPDYVPLKNIDAMVDELRKCI